MTWRELLAEDRIESHKTSKQELDGLRSAVNRSCGWKDEQKGEGEADHERASATRKSGRREHDEREARQVWAGEP